nr:MAG TPA_asm: hypothetical protein [Caudoviricetes sp.]
MNHYDVFNLAAGRCESLLLPFLFKIHTFALWTMKEKYYRNLTLSYRTKRFCMRIKL